MDMAEKPKCDVCSIKTATTVYQGDKVCLDCKVALDEDR
jgi:hypothetical protein